MSDQQQQPKKKKKRSKLVTCFGIGIGLVIVYLCINLATVALFRVDDAEPETPINEKITVEAKPTATEIVAQEPTKAPIDTLIPEPTETPIPEPTTWVGVIDCPACVEEGDNIPLTLWAEIGDMGSGSPKVYHGDICVVLDIGVTEEAPGIDPGIEKYKLDCDGKIGWLRAEGVKPAE